MVVAIETLDSGWPWPPPPAVDPLWAGGGFTVRAAAEPAAWAALSIWKTRVESVLAHAGPFYWDIVPTCTLHIAVGTSPRKAKAYSIRLQDFLRHRPGSTPPPPPFIFERNGCWVVSDGSHRVAAWRLCRHASIAVVRFPGHAEARYAYSCWLHEYGPQ